MKKAMRLILWGTFGIYCIILVGVLLIGRRGYRNGISFATYLEMYTNLIPLKTIINYINWASAGTINRNTAIANIVANLLLLVPMGIYLPCFREQFRKFGRFILTIFVIILAVEVLQLLFKVGSFDVDDILLNTLGAVMGFCIWKIKYVQKLLHKLHLIQGEATQAEALPK